MGDEVVHWKEHVHIGQEKEALKVFDPGIGYHGSCFGK
jgi:hypothetical protein